MQAITQCARMVYTKPVEIRMPHIVGATLAVALMQGGASPVPAVFPGNACGVQGKLYLCGKISRQASQRCSNRGAGEREEKVRLFSG